MGEEVGRDVRDDGSGRDDRSGRDDVVVRLEGVRLTYDEGSTWALDDVTLEVQAGERICVLGANGSGKSTLASVICGLLAPDEGTVELMGEMAFDGHSADADAYRHARHHIGLVFQNPDDQIVTTVVADDVAFGPENLGVEPAQIARRVDRELARVAMGDYADADPSRLSGGQQQRIAIAGALAMEPDMLVLDEPGALLDVRGRRGIMHVMDGLSETGTTIVHVTHFMDEALAATRVIVLDHGRIVADGTPDQVLRSPSRLAALGLEAPFVVRLADALDGTGTGGDETSGAGDEAVPRDRDGAYRESGVRLDRVSFSYADGGTRGRALSDVSADIPAGQLVAICGQTGSGKSTLARLVCALGTPDDGRVLVDGIDVTDRGRRMELRGHVGYVMQRPERQLFADTVSADVAYGPTNLGLSDEEVRRRVDEVLDFLGLTELAGRSPFDLSGGQRRLVALAGVLAMGPDVLVLDEPTAGLDPRGRRHLRDIVHALHASGTTILMVTHSMDDVARLADRMLVLDAGRVVADGSPAEVFSHGDELQRIGLGVPDALAWARHLEASAHRGGLELGLGEPITLGGLVAAIDRAGCHDLARRTLVEGGLAWR
ncbi:MAG: energy-coupling factor transporter ATPase [Atopobiaceae bacterium]|jgi:energy-coupling factor transport system ATP-binding protein|nr:energy-coupling factor transporter ATPase [Atopobiaceae bacterium]MCI2173978.1 energy-coupling factor transporter ATPase [Atopobiaceae bacterium]MCI2207932.1 energy-coupling factor transporter ATPase [Atopobiaceae bacterium]